MPLNTTHTAVAWLLASSNSDSFGQSRMAIRFQYIQLEYSLNLY